MPHPTKSKTHFDKIDCNKARVVDWAKEYGEGSILCILYNRKVNVDHSDMAQINLHCRTAEHSKLSREMFSTPQPKFIKTGSTITLGMRLDRRVDETEVPWAFKLADKTGLFEARMTLVRCSSE